MAQLTKKQCKHLEQVRNELRRGINYLLRPEVIGIAEEVKDPNGGDYTIRNPKVIETTSNAVMHIRPMNKQIGSNIAGLYTALQYLEMFLDADAYPQIARNP